LWLVPIRAATGLGAQLPASDCESLLLRAYVVVLLSRAYVVVG
jgi:hypothetical protein